MNMRFGLVLAGTLMALSACATGSEEPSATTVYDPLEGWNRGVYAFNEEVDKAVLGPVAMGYRTVTNKPVRQGVSNFLTNLNQPVVFANTVLQGKPIAAVDTAARFVLNSTAGVAGVFDLATMIDIPRHREDFGQTLGTWGVTNGPYLMLPLVGPANLRDLSGRGVDAALNPLSYAKFEGDTEFRIATGIIGAISVRESLDEQIQVLRDQPEPYIALRRNYTQQREAAIRDGKEQEDPFKDLPDFDAYDFGDEDEIESQE